jgi:5-methylthioribose kinase
LAHVADLEKITDTSKRAAAELRAIELGRALIMQRAQLAQMDAVLTLVQQVAV